MSVGAAAHTGGAATRREREQDQQDLHRLRRRRIWPPGAATRNIPKTRKRLLSEPLSRRWRIGDAEREGFEPSIGFKPNTAFPVLLLRPLGHLSGERNGHSTPACGDPPIAPASRRRKACSRGRGPISVPPMSTPPPQPSPTLFFETVNAYQRTAAIRAAIELGLF